MTASMSDDAEGELYHSNDTSGNCT